MKKKIIILVATILFFILFYFVFEFGGYLHTQKINKKMVSYCSQYASKDCYKKMFELLMPQMLIYEVYDKEEPIPLLKMDKTPVWNTSLAFESSDVFVRFYDKSLHSPICHSLYEQKVQDKLNLQVYQLSFATNIEFDNSVLNLIKILEECRKNNKKVVIKLDVINLQENFINKLLQYSDVINSFILFSHLDSQFDIIRLQKCLNLISDDYILTSRNSDYGDANTLLVDPRGLYKSRKIIPTKYYNGYLYDSTMILSFINKNIVDKYNISLEQNSEKLYVGKKVNGHRPFYKTQTSNIHWVVTFTEIIKQKMKKWIRH